MPRPNPARLIGSEEALARRIEHERTAREMSYEGLAKRMTLIGCPLQPSAIYKIERQQPRRRVTVDEMVAFGQVFDLGLDELLQDPGLAVDEEARHLYRQWHDTFVEKAQLDLRQLMATEALRRHLTEHPNSQNVIRAELQSYSETFGDEAREDLMRDLTEPGAE